MIRIANPPIYQVSHYQIAYPPQSNYSKMFIQDFRSKPLDPQNEIRTQISFRTI